jgi:hypothetical protein
MGQVGWNNPVGGQFELPFPIPDPGFPKPRPGALAMWILEHQGEPCYWCGEPYEVSVWEIYPQDRAWRLMTCCEMSYAEILEDMRERWTPEDWRLFFKWDAGYEIRRVVPELEFVSSSWTTTWPIDWGVSVHPMCKLKERRTGKAPEWCLFRGDVWEYIQRHHRHAGEKLPSPSVWKLVFTIWNGPPSGRVIYGTGKKEEAPKIDRRGNTVSNLWSFPDNLIGACVCANVNSRELSKQYKKAGLKVLELRRLALNHSLPPELTYKAASTAYRHAAKKAKELGYDRIITYTLKEEHGKTLKYYAKWKPVYEGRASKRGRRGETREGAMAEGKIRWEKNLTKKGREAK